MKWNNSKYDSNNIVYTIKVPSDVALGGWDE